MHKKAKISQKQGKSSKIKTKLQKMKKPRRTARNLDPEPRKERRRAEDEGQIENQVQRVSEQDKQRLWRCHV